MIALIKVCATTLHATVSWASQAQTALLALAPMNVMEMESVLIGLVFVILDTWERLAHLKDVKEVAIATSTVMTERVRVTPD
jgi:hypothetical protein